MDPIDRLGPNLQHAGHDYELWLQRDHWFLYRGEPNGTSFRFFVIIRADLEPRPAKSEIQYRLKKAIENVNVCGPFFCNQWVARDKFLKLSRGETSSMKYRSQNRQQHEDKKIPVDLPALERLSLADVFNVLEGK